MRLRDRSPEQRKRPPGGGLWDHEIEEGRSVVQNWDRELFEPWSARKARLAASRSSPAKAS